jgi:hypothetical protein
MTLVPVAALLPNPFRNIDRYPYDEAKLVALRESIAATGMWPNLIGRIAAGGFELPYGHHRLKVLREDHPGEQVELQIRELTDDAMMQIMARENLTEWGTNAAVEMETVRAVVEACAAGRITLGEVPDKTKLTAIRDAPSFALGEDAETPRHHPYTAQQVACYIGWVMPNGRPKQKVYDVLQALELIEEGILDDSDYLGLTTSQAQVVTERARRVRDEQRRAARAYEERAAADIAAAAAAREAREAAREDRERAERELAALRDAQAKEAAEKAAQAAQAAYDQADRKNTQAQTQQRQSAQLAKQQKDYGRQQAGGAGRTAREQMRAGASTREAAAQAVAASPYAEGARRAISVIKRFLAEGDLPVLLAAIGNRPEAKIPEELREDLAAALEELSNSALQFRGMVLRAEMAGSPS